MDLQKKRYFNIRPVVIVSTGLILGILTAYLFYIENAEFSLCLFILFACILLATSCFFFISKRNGAGLLAILTLLSFAIGNVNLHFDANSERLPFEEMSGTFKGRVVDVSEEKLIDKEYEYVLVARVKLSDDFSARVRLYLNSNERIYVGSGVEFDGIIIKQDISNITLSSNCNYISYVYDQVKVTGVEGVSAKLKLRLLNALEGTMYENYGVNYALLTGDTQYIPQEILAKYRNIGIAHIFAVSGLHIGLMFALISLLFGFIGVNKTPKFIVTTFILLLYVGFCGFSASTLRAFVIITVAQTAKLLGFKPDSTTALAASAFIVLTINPSDLFSIGFLLSYAVYSGLILLTNPLTCALSKILPEKVALYISPYFSASIASFPLLLDTFGYVSIFSFLFNMLIVPLVGFFYVFSLLGGILVLIFPTAWIFSVVPNLLFTGIKTLLFSINTSIFMIEGVSFGFAVIPYYLLCYSFAEKVNLSAKNYLVLRIIILISLILSIIAVNLSISP